MPPKSSLPLLRYLERGYCLCCVFGRDPGWGSGREDFFAAHHAARLFYRVAQPRVHAAATDVGDRGVDFCVGRIAVFLEQYRRGHDEARRAKSALHRARRHERLLHGVAAVPA